MKLTKGRLIVTGAVLQKTDKYGKSVEIALEKGDDGLYLVEKNGASYSVHSVSIVPEEAIIVKKIEEVVKPKIKPRTVKRDWKKKKKQEK